MAGLVKAKKYDWKDSNMALFGSDTEKKVKKESAQTEPAWKGAGEKVGMQIWRIVKFKVTHWPKDEYGKFYNGDSYILLNTYKDEDSEALLYDVHFWIGQYSSQDEYGTAAYKTVELDTLLDDKPVQHREVMNHESELFRGYFSEIQLLQGGAETGFNHVVTNKLDYKPRLLHFDGDTRDAKTKKRKVTVRERPLCKKSLDSDDVFILDKGEDLYLWLGKTANKDEKFAAVQYMQKLKEERRGRVKTENIDERDDDANRKFRAMLPDETDEEGIADDDEEADDQFEPSLFRLSDAGGQMEFSCVSQGSIPRSMLDSSDVFIADTGKAVFVWVGKGASEGERKNGMTYAHNYLMKTKHPLVPVTQVAEGKENKAFLAIVS